MNTLQYSSAIILSCSRTLLILLLAIPFSETPLWTQGIAPQDSNSLLVLPRQVENDSSSNRIHNATNESDHTDLTPRLLSATTAREARKLYDAAQYDAALQLYLSILSTQTLPSAALYYNIGCCHYRLHAIGQAILYFERATRLSPSDRDIEHNLHLTRTKTIDRLDQSALYKYPLWHNMAKSVGLFSSVTLSILLALLVATGVLLFLVGRQRRNRRIGFYIVLIALPFFLVFQLMGWYVYRDYIHTDSAIVLALEAPVRSTPDMHGSTLFVLHEGSKIRITGDRLGEWIPITVGADKQGWINTEMVEFIHQK